MLPSLSVAQVEVVSVDPPQNALSVPRNAPLEATFNMALNENTVVDTNVVVFAERTGMHFGTLSYDAASKTLTFDPERDFQAGERVTVTLTNKIKGLSGENFPGFSWHFTVQTFAADKFDFVFRGEVAAGGTIHLDAADFNNDGYPDLIAADDIFDEVFFYLNDTHGGFYFVKSLLKVKSGISPITHIADFNKDGLTDILVDGPNIFLINLGNANFAPHEADSLIDSFSDNMVADFDNDGNLDFVATPVPGDSLRIYKGLGGTSRRFQRYLPLPARDRITTPNEEIFDLNNDGQLDLIVKMLPYDRDSLAVYMNAKNLVFTLDRIYDPRLGFSFNQEYTNDINNDGYLDHVVMGTPRSENSRFLMLNDRSGGFVFSDYIPPQFRATYVNGGDFDGDGDIDLILGWTKALNAMPLITEGHIMILRNEGNQEFVVDREFTIGEGVKRPMFLDMDNDGDLDILGIKKGNNIFWMENTLATTVENTTESELIKGFQLMQNYPNPFNSSTQINYAVAQQAEVQIRVYDITGKEVKTLVNQTQVQGRYQIRWDGLNNLGKEVSSGIYFILMKIGNSKAVNRAVLL
ncbi:MAG: T9SS C-terminal target domain-containing protein, partial [Calditrichaeota bacterium]